MCDMKKEISEKYRFDIRLNGCLKVQLDWWQDSVTEF